MKYCQKFCAPLPAKFPGSLFFSTQKLSQKFSQMDYESSLVVFLTEPSALLQRCKRSIQTNQRCSIIFARINGGLFLYWYCIVYWKQNSNHGWLLVYHFVRTYHFHWSQSELARIETNDITWDRCWKKSCSFLIIWCFCTRVMQSRVTANES